MFGMIFGLLIAQAVVNSAANNLPASAVNAYEEANNNMINQYNNLYNKK